MRNNLSKNLWSFCNQYSPETTVFDTYLEEKKSQRSSPNTIINQTGDIKEELLNTMKFLQDTNSEINSIKQLQKYEFRKSLLKILQKGQASNKNIIKQVIRIVCYSKNHESLKKKLLNAVENSQQEKFLLIFSELGQNNTPIGVYEVNDSSAKKLLGPEELPGLLTDADIRFSLKYDLLTNKFKVTKTKTMAEEIDAVILKNE